MSIAVLHQAYEETRRLAIAGSGLARGDFRLKRLVPALEKAGEKAPVFARVAAGVEALVESDETSATAALLELGTLLSAILYTQGRTGAEGELRALETCSPAAPRTDTSARVLQPLIEALTTTGPGRLEVVRDAHRRGAFRDLRLVRPAVAALDDPYPEIAELVFEHVLPGYGRGIVPLLVAAFDPRGRAGDVRRLRLIHRLDPAAALPLAEQALESGSKDVRVAALACLEGSAEHLPVLLEQTRARSKDVRQAAYTAIATLPDDEVAERLVEALTSADAEIAIGAASRSRSRRLGEHLVEQGTRQLAELLDAKDEAKRRTLLRGFLTLLRGFSSRPDPASSRFLLGCFERHRALAGLRGREVDGGAVVLRVAALMARSDDPELRRALVAETERLPAGPYGAAFVAALRTLEPGEVFDRFSPALGTSGWLGRRKPAKDPGKQEVVAGILRVVGFGGSPPENGVLGDLDRLTDILRSLDSGGATGGGSDVLGELDLEASRPGVPSSALLHDVRLDPRWLDAVIAAGDLSTLLVLARPGHPGAERALADALKQLLGQRVADDLKIAAVLEAMLRIGHPRTVECFLEVLEARHGKGRPHRYGWWLFRLIPDLPPEAGPRIEALLPRLVEPAVDDILLRLEALKAREQDPTAGTGEP